VDIWSEILVDKLQLCGQTAEACRSDASVPLGLTGGEGQMPVDQDSTEGAVRGIEE